MMLAIRYVMVSTVLLGFWCSSYALPAAHAQDPVQEAQQAVNDAQAKAKAAQKAAGEAHAKVDEAQAKVDAATQERDLAKLIADKKQATFQNATGGTEALAEGAFVSAAAALNEKQRNLKGEIRAQEAAEKDLKTRNQALTTAQTTLATAKAKAAYEAPPAIPGCRDVKECDPSQCGAKTIQCLTQCIKKNPFDFESLLCRGHAYLCKGLPSVAEADFREVLRLDPDDIEALVGWARAAEKQQRWQTAIERYNRAIAAAERAFQPVPGQLHRATVDPGTCLYCAAMGRARSHMQLATSDDAKNGGSEAASVDDQPLLHCEAAVRDVSQAIRYAPCSVDLECAQCWIRQAQDWQKKQSKPKAMKAGQPTGAPAS